MIEPNPLSAGLFNKGRKNLDKSQGNYRQKRLLGALFVAALSPLFSTPAMAGKFDYELFATDGSDYAQNRLNGYAVGVQVFRAGEGGNRSSTNYTSGDFCGEILEYTDYAKDWWNNWANAGYGIVLRFKRESVVCRLR